MVLNKKSSEETLKVPVGIVLQRKQQEPRFKSNVRGADVPNSMTRNPSKPALELPAIQVVKGDPSRNEMSINLTSNRSKKSLSIVQGQPLKSPQGYNMPHVQLKREIEARRGSNG